MNRRLLGSQILSARPGGDKPEGSDPESQIQELQKESARREKGDEQGFYEEHICMKPKLLAALIRS